MCVTQLNSTSIYGHIRGVTIMRYINLHFTLLYFTGVKHLGVRICLVRHLYIVLQCQLLVLTTIHLILCIDLSPIPIRSAA